MLILTKMGFLISNLQSVFSYHVRFFFFYRLSPFDKYEDFEAFLVFIDSSKRSLKCVLLHNGNLFGSVPIGHSVSLCEEYGDMKRVIELLEYHTHNWVICVDLKMLGVLLGQQRGYTKYPCYLCMWDSRAREKHWVESDWPPRSALKPGDPNILYEPLVDRKNVIFPPLHLKLGLMKQFVKALKMEGDCFRYLLTALPGLSYEKIKAGVFDGPQIRQLIRDPNFIGTMTELEKRCLVIIQGHCHELSWKSTSREL